MKEILLLNNDKYRTVQTKKELINVKYNLYYIIDNGFIEYYYAMNDVAICVGLGKYIDENSLEKYINEYKLPTILQEYIEYCNNIFDLKNGHLAFMKMIDEAEYKKLKAKKNKDELDFMLIEELLRKEN